MEPSGRNSGNRWQRGARLSGGRLVVKRRQRPRAQQAAQQPSPSGFSGVDRTVVIELGRGGRHRAVARKARCDRPDHEREDTGKEAEAEVAVFAETIEHCDERDQK